jgi:DNA-binding MarR family transcriptional regulator/GNAT superfamily N-acetyltransferase
VGALVDKLALPLGSRRAESSSGKQRTVIVASGNKDLALGREKGSDGGMSATAGLVAAVRSFSRSYTSWIGVLDEGLLDTPYSLTESRVLFELAQREATDVTALRRAIGVDGGYLSRILARFAADGLIERERSEADGRRQVVRLTDQGRAAAEMLDGRSREQLEGLLADLDAEQQRQLAAAMGTVEKILAGGRPDTVTLRPMGSGDYGWVVQRHGVLYAAEYRWNESFEALVARVVADYVDQREDDPKRVAAWVAEVDGKPAGSVFCMRKDERTAQLRLLLVEPTARGLGVGGRLVDECIRFARDAGYDSLTLWTNDVLVDARRIYQRAGFTLVEEEAHHSFGHDLVGQNWELRLIPPGGSGRSTAGSPARRAPTPAGRSTPAPG